MTLGPIVLGGVAGYVLHAALHLRRRPLRSVAEPLSGVTVLGPHPGDERPACSTEGCSWCRPAPYDQEVDHD